MHYRGNKYNYKRPKLAHILGQLGVVLTWVPQQCWLQLQSGRGNVEGPGEHVHVKDADLLHVLPGPETDEKGC